MLFKVTVDFINPYTPKLKGVFNSVHINEESQYLMLFQDISNSYEGINKVVRYAIPLTDIDKLEVIPDEDNGQKVFSS